MLESASFWTAVSFLIFLALVYVYAREMILGGLDDRAKAIKSEIDEAERLREEAQAALANYQRKQREAVTEAAEILDSAKEEAERLKAHTLETLENSLKLKEQRALDRIAQAEGEAVAELRNRAADIAIAATKALIADHLDAQENNRLISEAISELPGKLH